jgi:hypothetical protein
MAKHELLNVNYFIRFKYINYLIVNPIYKSRCLPVAITMLIV